MPVPRELGCVACRMKLDVEAAESMFRRARCLLPVDMVLYRCFMRMQQRPHLSLQACDGCYTPRRQYLPIAADFV